MNTKSRIVITGLGAVSPLGNDLDSTWGNLLDGKSGVAAINSFDASGFPTNIAAEVKKFNLSPALHKKYSKYLNRFTRFALEAAHEALIDACILPKISTAKRWGLVVGSGMMTAEFEYLQRFQQFCAAAGEPDWLQMYKNEQDFFRVTDFGQTNSNTGLSVLAQAYGIQGYATSVHTACASGGQALGLALRVMQRGDADYILAGGFDSMIHPLGLASFCLLGALSTNNQNPEQASRPFDALRSGFVLAEGAAFLVLETYEKAISRGARIYAELVSEGNSLSSYRITDSHPNGDGAMQAIQRALNDAGLKPQKIDYVNAHGTSTKMNDLSETNAIKAALGDHAYNIPVSSTKSQTGHLIAAAGALEAVFAVKSIYHDVVPPTMNLTNPDPECDLDYVTEGLRYKNINAVLSNSFGFGGSNSSLIFTKPDFVLSEGA